MKKYFALFLMTMAATQAQEVKVTSGKVVRFPNFKSQFVDARNVDVWLPDGYSDKQQYAVLYMHDGQMLFDPETTWNKQSWEVDATAGQLIADKKTQPFIVVGIWNNNLKRHQEYFPRKAFESLDDSQRKFVSDILLQQHKIDTELNPISDDYLKFLVTELKPFIDKTFATKADQSHTFIAGSSMGGLISMYAICEYPKVFGGAACLSTHWSGIYQLEDNPVPDAFFAYMKKQLPSPKRHKLYFDCGDKTLDALYPTLQQKADLILESKGYTDKNLMSKFFAGKDHSEAAWRERLDIPLQFLLGK
jgi:enterochelin esterase-like enzyme